MDAIAVPVIIHRNDLKKIAPLWLQITAQVRENMRFANDVYVHCWVLELS